MNSLWQVPAVVIALLAWLNAPPSGLADIAARESFRRQATQKSQASLTNLGVPPEAVPMSAVTMPAPPPAPTDPAAGAPAAGKDAAKDPAAKPPEPPRDEAWWRAKMTEARNAVAKGQFAADTVQTRINALQSDAVNIDDPVRQGKARLDLARAMEELEQIKKKIDADVKAIAALQDEARRQNVPPGWIR